MSIRRFYARNSFFISPSGNLHQVTNTKGFRTVNYNVKEPLKLLCAGLCLVTQLCPTLYPAGLLCPWEFSKQENWSELPFPSPGDLPDQVIEPRFPALQADSLQSELQGNMYTKIFFVMAFDMKGKIK